MNNEICLFFYAEWHNSPNRRSHACQVFSSQKKAPPPNGRGSLVEFGLLPATQDECESAKAEKGGGGRLRNCREMHVAAD